MRLAVVKQWATLPHVLLGAPTTPRERYGNLSPSTTVVPATQYTQGRPRAVAPDPTALGTTTPAATTVVLATEGARRSVAMAGNGRAGGSGSAIEDWAMLTGDEGSDEEATAEPEAAPAVAAVLICDEGADEEEEAEHGAAPAVAMLTGDEGADKEVAEPEVAGEALCWRDMRLPRIRTGKYQCTRDGFVRMVKRGVTVFEPMIIVHRNKPHVCMCGNHYNLAKVVASC